MKTRILSIKQLRTTTAYAGLSPRERGLLDASWEKVPVSGFVSTAGLRKWLARRMPPATRAKGLVLAKVASEASRIASQQVGGAWDDNRLGSAAQKVWELAGHAGLPAAFDGRDSAIDSLRKLAGSPIEAGISPAGPETSGLEQWLVPFESKEHSVFGADGPDSVARQGIGFEVGDRAAERDARLSEWGRQLDLEVGLGNFSPRASRDAYLVDPAAQEDNSLLESFTDEELVMAAGMAGSFGGLLAIVELAGALAATPVGEVLALGAIGTAEVAEVAVATLGSAELITLGADAVAGTAWNAALNNMLEKTVRYIFSGSPGNLESPFGPQPTREESEALRQHYFGPLEGTPYAVRGLSSVERNRPRANPHASYVDPNRDASEHSEGAARRPPTGQRLEHAADPLRSPRAGAVRPASFEQVDPRSVDPFDVSDGAASERAPGRPRPSVAAKNRTIV